MKRLTIVLSIAALALPLCAQDKPNTTTTVLAQPPAAQGEDSPLVRAAKATQKTKTKKASIVITNETLTKTGGHLYVANPSANTAPLPKPLPQPDPAAVRLEASLKAKADAEAKANQESGVKKEKKLKAAAGDYYGESIEERVDDPAQQEHVMDQMTSTQPATATSAPPPTATPTKPPQE
jgi:hypothetical protein